MLSALIAALLAPWLLGVLGMRVLRLPWPVTMGAAYLVGMIGLTLLLRLWSGFGLLFNFLPLLLLLLTLALCITPLAVKYRPVSLSYDVLDLSAWQRVIIIILLVLLTGRYLALTGEIAWRPLFAWDAWASWSVKAKVWFYQQTMTPFVSAEEWLQSGDHSAYTVIGTDYPVTIPLIQTWAALAWGTWLEAAANSPWLLCAIALGLGFYGQCRAAGAGIILAVLLTYLLLSLPLLNAHVALAGYADLWLASCYGLAAAAVVLWCINGERGQLVLTLILGACLPLLKAEGTVWALTLTVPILVRLIGRWIWLLMLGLLVGCVIWFMAGGVRIGAWVITPKLIDIPRLGRFTLQYTNNWPAVRDQLLLVGSWHLLWYLAPFSLLALFGRRSALFYGAVLLSVDLVMLYILFFFTHAAAWAEDGTAINRLFLHIAPLAVFLILLMLSPRTASRSVEQRAQS